MLKKLETEERNATWQEQEILSKYVGWGGIPEAFDEKRAQWANEYQELKETLTEEEYIAARASTLNAHFTSPAIIRGIYAALERMGFQGGIFWNRQWELETFLECCQRLCWVAVCMELNWIPLVAALHKNCIQWRILRKRALKPRISVIFTM